MEDLSTLIWLGIGILWFLTRFVRRGAKKVAQAQKRQPRPTVSRPTVPDPKASRTRIEERNPAFSGRGDKGPPPIVPR